MIEEKLAADILTSVDARFDDQVVFTQGLIQFESVRGEEHHCQDYIYKELETRGLEMDRWAIDVSEIENHRGFSPVKVDYTNAINVVGTHRPRKETGKSLILNGHVDVVPVGPLDMWTRPPFERRLKVTGCMVAVVRT